MIELRQVTEPPEGADDELLLAWARSAWVWEARYGSRHDDTNHIAYLGLIPLDILNQTGYWWFDLNEPNPTRSMLKQARLAFLRLIGELGWTTYAHTREGMDRHKRFAEFFGFESIGSYKGQTYLERTL